MPIRLEFSVLQAMCTVLVTLVSLAFEADYYSWFGICRPGAFAYPYQIRNDSFPSS
jgi:hypothetical protein